ncbi:MAG: sporulation protein YqfD [Clostridiales bacterium]|nr:sporulation protein YqfD [Clostridiales bacterium]
MFLKKILDYIFGKVTILVEGFFIEKYINICTNRKIELSNIQRENSCMFTANVSIKDYKKLKNIGKKTKCKYKIVKKRGLPFILHKYRKRRFLLLIPITIIILLIISTSFIYDIRIVTEGEEYTEEYKQYIIQELEKLGVKKYIYKYNIDDKNIENQMLINVEDLSWIEFKIKGVVLNVDIRKRVIGPEVINNNEFSNIIAIKPGIIEKVVATQGKSAVEKGDMVYEGDVLISGVIPSEIIDEKYVNAQGEVFAKVWYKEDINVNFYEENTSYTGSEIKRFGTKLLNKKIFFGKLSTNYKEYDTIINESKLSVKGKQFPIVIYEYIIKEKVTTSINRTYEEALKYANEILEKNISTNFNQDTVILNKSNNITEYNGGVNVELIYECLEQIGTKEKIY